jgi:demethylmenaquinone methyltransferase/2-methoxy-6-polyprenyl-1,4-benzoquinol methylase
VFGERDDVQRRRLNDGSEHRVVKIFYEPAELAERLAGAGWRVRVAGTRWFIYGSGQRAAAGPESDATLSLRR